MSFLDRLRPYPELRTVIVNLKTGAAFRGVVWRRRGPFLVLRNTTMLRNRQEATPVDGEVVVDRAEIEFIQVL